MGFVGKEPAEAALTSADITDGIIVNADINASAAIAMSKTAFSAGTGITLSTNTLNVDAAQTGITSLLATNIKIGEDDQTKIDFEDDNKINFYANNAKEVELAENSLSPGTSDGTALGTTSLMWSDLFLASGSVINFNNGDVTLTHSGNTLTVAGGTLATAALTSTTITASGIIKTDDSTNATSTTDGSLQTDGGLSVALDAVIGDDLMLLSDSAILSLGAGNDATLTHDGTTGLTIAATPISIDSTGELHLNSTTGDIKLQDGGTDQITFDLDGTAGEVIMKPAVDSDDLVISQYDGTEVIRIEDNASLGLVGNKLSIANSSSDVVIKPLTDAKDIIFQQYDGTEVARIEDNATFNVSSAGKFAYAGTAVTATAAELNLLDGGTSVGGSITLADADGVVVNDGGTMKTIPASDVKTYIGSAGQFTATAAQAIDAGDSVGMDATGKVAPIELGQGAWIDHEGDRHYDYGSNSENSNFEWIDSAYDPDTDRHLVVWSNAAYDVWSVVVAGNDDASNSNTEATFGTPVKVYDGGSDKRPYYPLVTYDTTADRFLVFYYVQDNSDNYDSEARARVGTVTGSSTNSVAYGTDTQLLNHQMCWDRISTYCESANVHVTAGRTFLYNSDNSTNTSNPYSVSIVVTGGGTNTPALGSQTVISDGKYGSGTASAITWDETNDRVVYIHLDNGNGDDYAHAIASISGSTLTWGAYAEFDTTPTSSSQCGSAVVHDPETNRCAVLVSRSDQNDCVFYVANVANSGQTMTSITLHDTNVISDNSESSGTMQLRMYSTAKAGLGFCALTDYQSSIQSFQFQIDADNNEVDKIGTDGAVGGSYNSRTTSYYTVDNAFTILDDTEVNEMTLFARSNTNYHMRYSNTTFAATSNANKIDYWVGIAGSAISKDASGTITTVGGNVGGFSGLTIGAYYSVGSSGSYTATDANNTTNDSIMVGFANSASTIQVTGAMANYQ